MSSNTLQNVVVVGAAASGLTTAQSLAKSLPDTHRVVLIEANPVAYWSIAALRGAVLPGFEDQVVHELSTKTVFGAGSRHIVLTKTRVVDLGADHVIVSRDVTSEVSGSTLDAEGRTKISLDRAVLGLGSDYGFPTRAATTDKSADDIKAHFVKMQNDIKNAQDILVIGGGPTGVEFVGEVLDVHPNKKITLLTRGGALASTGDDAFVEMSKKLLSQLQAKGVRVILDDSISKDLATGPIDPTSFTTKKGVELTADYVMVALGGRPNTEWVKSSHPELVDSKGYLKVTDAFVLDAPGWERYYSLGDAANTPGSKTYYIATQHAPLVAHNVAAAVKGTSDDKLKRVNGAPGALMVVPIGKSGGAGYLGFATVGGWITSFAKGKTLFVSKFHGAFKA